MNLLVFNEKMDSTPLKKGFLPSSTPIQSFCDSGFFGSSNKCSFTKIVHTLSPVKESSPSKKRYTELIQLAKTYSLETPRQLKLNSTAGFEESQYISSELAKELDFNDLSEFSENLIDCSQDSDAVSKKSDCSQIPSFQKQELFSPEHEWMNFQQYSYEDSSQFKPLSGIFNESNYPDKVKKILFSPVKVDNSWKEKVPTLKLKNKKIDFLNELSNINCGFIVSSILSSLSSDDLCRICCVSKKWKSIVLHDIKANSRRKEFIREEIARKENKPSKTLLEVEKEKQTFTGERKTVLSDVINTITISKQPLEKRVSRFDSFVKEGQNLKNGILMKCPACQYAAKKADDGDEYCCTKCSYAFCCSCLSPFKKNHSCSRAKVSMIIGSKRSKKALKRL